MALVLVAAACSSSNDPNSWTEAGETDQVRTNFVKACQTANEGVDQLSQNQAASYCTQTFEALVDYYGGEIMPDGILQDSSTATVGRDFEAFLQLDKDLRSDPTSIPSEITEILSGIIESVTSG